MRSYHSPACQRLVDVRGWLCVVTVLENTKGALSTCLICTNGNVFGRGRNENCFISPSRPWQKTGWTLRSQPPVKLKNFSDSTGRIYCPSLDLRGRSVCSPWCRLPMCRRRRLLALWESLLFSKKVQSPLSKCYSVCFREGMLLRLTEGASGLFSTYLIHSTEYTNIKQGRTGGESQQQPRQG